MAKVHYSESEEREWQGINILSKVEGNMQSWLLLPAFALSSWCLYNLRFLRSKTGIILCKDLFLKCEEIVASRVEKEYKAEGKEGKLP